MWPAICELMEQFNEAVIVVDQEQKIVGSNHSAKLQFDRSGMKVPKDYSEFLTAIADPSMVRVLRTKADFPSPLAVRTLAEEITVLRAENFPRSPSKDIGYKRDSSTRFRKVLEDLTRAWNSGGNAPFFAVSFLDLARFRAINDSFGYAAGDGLLLAVAQCARKSLRQDDIVAHFGADHFAVLFRSVKDAREAEHRMRNLLLNLGGAFDMGGALVHIVPRAGLAFPDGIDVTADSMLRDADAAHQQAKQQREPLMTSRQPGSVKSPMQISLEFDLARALENDEFFFEFQPVFDPQNGRVRLLEALLRWRHPRLGVISPASFISLAEDSGLVLNLDMLGLERLGRQLSIWRAENPRIAAVPVSINISGRHFPNFVMEEQFHRILRQPQLRDSRIIFEITESVFVEGNHRTTAGLERLRDAGVQIWLDDFGEGYSSFRYLTHFPIDGIKIAACFVRSCADQPRSRVVLSSLQSLARGMGMQCIAEGVETAEQFETLKVLGFDALQGYYLARPMAAKDIPSLFAEPGPRRFALARSA